MSTNKSELLLGTLDMLALRTLALEPMHGWGLSLRIEQISRGVFQINQGSLYPALQRLKRKGLITSEWRMSENNRRARYYEITRAGRKQLKQEVAEWGKITGAVNRILTVAPLEV
ncbi:PadR family transcriptional regulator [Candidatus Zixiibacteriota bacterium]